MPPSAADDARITSVLPVLGRLEHHDAELASAAADGDADALRTAMAAAAPVRAQVHESFVRAEAKLRDIETAMAELAAALASAPAEASELEGPVMKVKNTMGT